MFRELGQVRRGRGYTPVEAELNKTKLAGIQKLGVYTGSSSVGLLRHSRFATSFNV
jgi:hypothetical protein